METALIEIIGILSILFLIIMPFIVFIICHYQRHVFLTNAGSQKLKFEIGDLKPSEIATLANGGVFRPDFFWPEVVRLATEKKLSIEDITAAETGSDNNGGPIIVKTSVSEDQFWKMDLLDRKLLWSLFSESRELNISLNREYLSRSMPGLGEIVRYSLFAKGLLSPKGTSLRNTYLMAGAFFLAAGALVIDLDFAWRLSALVSGSIALGFWLTTPNTTGAGRTVLSEIKEFSRQIDAIKKGKKSMTSKVGDFEKMLPRAMALGMGEALIKKYSVVYGKDFFDDYRPDWYSASASRQKFNGAGLYEKLRRTFSYNPFLALGLSPRKQFADL